MAKVLAYKILFIFNPITQEGINRDSAHELLDERNISEGDEEGLINVS